jgi:putative Holliday junction resolvase
MERSQSYLKKLKIPKTAVHHNNPREFIGVDVGSVRVGLARGSDAARMAEPLKTLPADEAIKQLADIVVQRGAAAVVVGLPRGLDGQDTPQTNLVREWLKQAQQAIKLPFYWQDEALTTKSAEDHDSKQGIDADAASVILQDFLDTPESDWNRC